MNIRFFSLANVLHRQPHRRHRHVDNQVDLFGVIPAPRNAGADIRLELMIADDHRDRLTQNLAAEIVHRHLRRGHGALAGGGGRRPVHVGEDADLDHVVRDLGQRRWRRQDSGCECREHGYFSGGNHSCPPLTVWRIGRIA
jgi:hypothetical protein